MSWPLTINKNIRYFVTRCSKTGVWKHRVWFYYVLYVKLFNTVL